jgi:hypothetical protein
MAPIKLFGISVQYRDVLNTIAIMDRPPPRDQAANANTPKNQSVSDCTGITTKNIKLALECMFNQSRHALPNALPKESLVLVESKDHKWLIVDKHDKDGDIAYIVQLEGMKLQVYQPLSSWNALIAAKWMYLLWLCPLFIAIFILMQLSKPELGVGD